MQTLQGGSAGGFVLRRHYSFGTPIETNCFKVTSVTPEKLERQVFSRGQFVELRPDGVTLRFQGTPDDLGRSGEVYFFDVTTVDGNGSGVTEVPPPPLRVINGGKIPVRVPPPTLRPAG